MPLLSQWSSNSSPFNQLNASYRDRQSLRIADLFSITSTRAEQHTPSHRFPLKYGISQITTVLLSIISPYDPFFLQWRMSGERE